MKLAICLILVAGLAWADVAPDSITITNTRGQAVTNLDRTVWAGMPLLINGVADQNLSNVTVTVSVGTAGLYASGTGTVTSATSGVWNVTVILPRGGGADPGYVQVKLTDASTNSYIYPHKLLTIKDPL